MDIKEMLETLPPTKQEAEPVMNHEGGRELRNIEYYIIHYDRDHHLFWLEGQELRSIR